MALVVIVAILIASATYFGAGKLEDIVDKKCFSNETIVNRNLDKIFTEFNAFVDKNQLKVTDEKLLDQWMNEHPYTYLSIFDNYKVYYENRWETETGIQGPKLEKSKIGKFDGVDIQNGTPRIDESIYLNDKYVRILNISGEDYYVCMDVYKEFFFFRVMDIVKTGISFVVLLFIILLYNSWTLKRIANISEEVAKASWGDLGHAVTAKGNDEIGLMAEGVENMRISLIEKLESEKEAYESNNQLITSISHDIRTPLTSLIGYLDIIDKNKYETEEELKKYITASKDKAFQLKDLSDKLFQYFLVFGKKEIQQNFETLNGDILFQQLLSEHIGELNGRGFTFELEEKLPAMEIETDVSAIRRLFDNLFSNIGKYADKKEPIIVNIGFNDNMIQIFLKNTINKEHPVVESTNIGVKTCQRIVELMRGEFFCSIDENYYITQIMLPLKIRA